MSKGETESIAYYIRIRGKIHGPFDVEKLKKLQKRGQFSRANEVSVDKHSWQPATTLIGVFESTSMPLADASEPAAISPDPVESEPLVQGKPKDDDQWYYMVGEVQTGPVSLAELQRLLSDGVLKYNHQVWRAGMTGFRLVSQCSELISDGRGRPWYSGWWIKGLAAASVTLLLAAMCAIGWFAYGHLGHGYGNLIKFNTGELYYSAPFSEEDARRLGNFLVTEKVFDGDQRLIQLVKGDKNYAVRIVVKKGLEMDQEAVHNLRQLRARISHQVFADAPVEIHMCDEHLNTLRVIQSEPLAGRSIDRTATEAP